MNIYKPPERRIPNRSAPNAQSVQKTTSVEQKKKTAQLKKATPADRVDILGRGREITEIMSATDRLPEVRDSKVQEIKQRVDAGTYTVDPRKIAESILKSR